MSDRFKTPHPLPNEAQREALNILIEECAEVAQRATKAARFGMREIQPGQKLRNDERLALEIGDLLTTVKVCLALGLLNKIDVHLGAGCKINQLRKFVQSDELHAAVLMAQADIERGKYV